MSEHLLVSFNKTKNINATIHLTGSKSECNRALIIKALSKGCVKVENLSIAADTVILQQSLKSAAINSDSFEQGSKIIDTGPAGTAMRFLTAYLATQTGSFELTGTQRMKQRPIGILVEALKSLGADISYMEKQGFPPLKINGPLQQKQQSVKVKGDISSQYISALLMVAPTLPMGLALETEGELTSKPYLTMTLSLLNQTGIAHQWNQNAIQIKPQTFNNHTIYIEPDWSAASYWYSVAALADKAKILLPGLKKNSLQGDSIIAKIMERFGVKSTFTHHGLYLEKITDIFTNQVFDMKECPDLAQTLVVICAALGYNATFTGLETLKIKETNRVLALQTELAKIGVKFTEENLFYKLDCSTLRFGDKIRIATYEDHRMAMAFAPLALKVKEIEIEKAKVVDKSYPDYWLDLKKAGFNINSNFFN